MKRMISLILACLMILCVTACAAKEDNTLATEAAAVTQAAPSEITVLGEGATVFYFSTTDLDGNKTGFEIRTDASTVGEALTAVSLISGQQGDYGLMVETVNGITLTWEADQAYWAFYEGEEYALCGVDSMQITPGAFYSLIATPG